MFYRDARQLIHRRLEVFDSVALTGPRQVGKTTLARHLAKDLGEGAIYLDLELQSDREKLNDAHSFFSKYSDRLIILDEIQRMPEIFQVLRVQIDERRRTYGMNRKSLGKYLFLGSASMQLLRQTSESLAGRVSHVEMATLKLSEILKSGDFRESEETFNMNSQEFVSNRHTDVHNIQEILNSLWLKGGFPVSFGYSNELDSIRWRQDFIQTYLERDLHHFGYQVEPEKLGRFWQLLAHNQGELFNAQTYARAMHISGHSAKHYLDILEKLLLVRRLQPWYSNVGKRLVKTPRVYIRDSGILHALLNLATNENLRKHAVFGKSWEGFAIESLIYSGLGRVKPYFYRTSAGAEADLVLELAPGRCWVVEIKFGATSKPSRGFYRVADDLSAERRLLVHSGIKRSDLGRDVEAMPLLQAMNEINEAAV